MPRVDDASAGDHGALVLVDLQAEVLLTRQEEVAHVEAGLEADDVAAQHAFEDRVAHVLGQHLPVLRGWPRDVYEVLDQRVRHGLSHQARDEVQLVVVHEHQRRFRRRVGQLDDLLRHLQVDLDVAVGPRLVDSVVDDRFVAEVPQVVLDEPQHRVGDHAVIHVVLLASRRRVVETAGPAGQPDFQALAGALGEPSFRVGARTGDPVRAGRFGQCQQGGDHASSTASEGPVLSGVVRPAIADEDGGPAGQRPSDVAAEATVRCC